MGENPYQPPRESGEPEKPKADWGRFAEHLAQRVAMMAIAVVVFTALAIAIALMLPRPH